MKWLTDALTERDGQTYCISRILGTVSFLVGISLEIYAVVWRGQTWDMWGFASGAGALLAGVGASVNLKSKDTGN